MSDTEQETAEPSEEIEYEVTISGTFSAYVTVIAADEDEAHDKAKEEARYLSSSDWENAKSPP